jgi:ankyrin repeat protein
MKNILTTASTDDQINLPTTASIDDQFAFLEAAQTGDIETLKELSKKNKDKDLLQTTLTPDIILRANKSGDLWSAKSLGFNALDYAFDGKHFKKVAQHLITSHDDGLKIAHPIFKSNYVRIIDSQDESLQTLLHKAVSGQDVNMDYVNFLLTKKPDVSKQNKDGNTALHLAFKNLSLRVTGPADAFGNKFLCARNLIANLIASNDATQNASINKTNKYGNTALHLAVSILKDYEGQKGGKIRGGLLMNPEKEIEETLASLIKSGADITIKNNDEQTALQIVKSCKDQIIYKNIISLLEGEAVQDPIPKMKAPPSGEPKDINSFNGEGLAQLHIACRDGFDLDFVVSLLKKGADVDLVDQKNKDTPLHHAIRAAMKKNNKNGIVIVEKLLENNANPLKPNKEGDTSIHIACSFNNKNETNTAQEKVLGDLLLEILKAGVSVNAINGVDGMTPLQIASEHESTSTMNLLIEERANIDYANKKNGNTALHYAVINDKYKAAKLLMKKGAKIDLINIDNKTPEQIAIEKGFHDIAGLLSKASTQQPASTSLIQSSDTTPSIIFPQVPSPTAPTMPTQEESAAVVPSALVLSGVPGDVYSYQNQPILPLPRPVTTSDTPTLQTSSEPPSSSPSCFSCLRVMALRLFVSNSTP